MSDTVDVSQTNVDPNTAVNPNPGSVDSTDHNQTTVSQWWDTQQAVGGLPNLSNFPWGQAANAILGGSGGGMGAGLALGLGALAAALSRQQAPTIKAPEYKAAPIYNRALTAPIFPPQPAPQKSASGQNIYTPLKGMPLFFNPNPFQFDPTEAAKKYGPTPEQIAKGQEGYEAGIASLYKPLSITPFTYGAATGQNQAPANQAPANQGAIDKERASSVFDINAVKAANPQLDWSKFNPNKMTMDYDDYDRAIDNFINKNNTYQSDADRASAQAYALTSKQPSQETASLGRDLSVTPYTPEEIAAYYTGKRDDAANALIASVQKDAVTAKAAAESAAKAPVQYADWIKNIRSGYGPQGQGARSEEEVPGLYRDPKSGYGVGVQVDSRGVNKLVYYDPQGRPLRSSIFTAEELYRNANEFGIDLSGIGDLGKQLDTLGIGYKPGELRAGTGSDKGINFQDIAAGKLGSAYDWTQDPFAYLKGPYASSQLADYKSLAESLGIKPETSENLSKIQTYVSSGDTRPYAIVVPSISGSPTIAYYSTKKEADNAAAYYGGKVYDLTSGSLKVNDLPTGGASGGYLNDIFGQDVYEFAKGHFLQGDGDGMSDSIPATINNKQPARLADGEFIVPADVVSDLGNGSSNAGAKKLYQMMNKIRKERHGTYKQPPQVKAERFMPK